MRDKSRICEINKTRTAYADKTLSWSVQAVFGAHILVWQIITKWVRLVSLSFFPETGVYSRKFSILGIPISSR